MTTPTIITEAVLRAHKGSDADLARTLGVTRSAVQQARTRLGLPRRPGLSKALVRAVQREGVRRGCTVLEVLELLGWDLGVA